MTSYYTELNEEEQAQVRKALDEFGYLKLAQQKAA